MSEPVTSNISVTRVGTSVRNKKSIYTATKVTKTQTNPPKYTTEIVMLTYVLPIFIISILSYYILNENFNYTMVVGLTIAIIGIIIFLYGGHHKN